ncbi:uncharacterized protein GGS22DRAFT_168931 [Annulohypoxylon maeteangense]|uniref:uncharacterized protein n=1 Tax=Annulohypoxylon maeteangense TaxID=1927788 RepID=UPI0020078353|nr:uncharacterized protein GGS22DRAFT_168931 [Annulohypoxylon maeteangense]KAI0882846.1 hypothetical protein GGS22DRAFT_168931 [Annulohypoxylon maeteangense]
MKVTLVLVLSHLSAVLAGGYQGCLERVQLFNAYEIDGLNAEADQTIGFKCAKADTKTKSCTQWNACKPKKNSGRTRCNFDDLMVFLGKAPTTTGWSVNDSSGKLDPEGTAKQCYKLFTSAPGKNPKVPNFPPHVAVKDAWEFNDYIKRVGDTVNKTYKNKGNSDNRNLFDSFDTTTEKVSESRAGDHGPHLIDAARTQLGGAMDIKTESVGGGSNPATGETWETVDWRETAAQAKAKGVPDVDKKIQGFLKGFYGVGGNSQARSHRVVIQSYKRVADRSQSCR